MSGDGLCALTHGWWPSSFDAVPQRHQDSMTPKLSRLDETTQRNQYNLSSSSFFSCRRGTQPKCYKAQMLPLSTASAAAAIVVRMGGLLCIDLSCKRLHPSFEGTIALTLNPVTLM